MAGPPEEIMPSTTTEVPPAEEQNVSDEVKDSLQGDDEPMEPPLSPANVPEKADLSELEGSGHESFGRVDDDEDPEEETTEEARSPTPPIQREVKVKFSGMEGPSPPPELDLGGVTRSQLVQKVGGLQERLTQTQIDLKQEKSARRKKDKNMFKMAKELSKRQVEATEKDEVIQKMNQLLKDMGDKLEKASALEDELRQTIAGYEQKLGNLAATGEVNAKTRVQSPMIPVQFEKPKPPSTPPPPMQTEKPKPPPPPKAASPSTVEKTSPPTQRGELQLEYRRGREAAIEQQGTMGGFSKTVTALSICLAVFVASLFFWSSDGVCAPVMPGTVLSAGDFAAEAPWWAPEGIKVSSFNFFCDGRPRVYVKQENGKLFLLEKQNGKMKTLHKADAARAKINGESIVVENKKGARTYIAAPWAL